MYEDARFEELQQQFEPMIYHAMKKLGLYKTVLPDWMHCFMGGFIAI
ncbi:hypothetical protein [Metabacillus schmidteae]|nr:hypothetical protein [Metabacillus schmidteae]